MSRSRKTGGFASCTMYFGKRTMPFFGLSTSRISTCSDSGFGSGFGGGGVYFGEAAASAAAASLEIGRVRFGPDGAGAFSGAGARMGDDAEVDGCDVSAWA